MTTYLGFDVLEIMPNRRDVDKSSSIRNAVILDPGTGKVTGEDKGKFAIFARPFVWFMENRADVDIFRSFYSARMGRAVPFWVPTWNPNLVLATDVLSTDTGITIKAIGYSTFFAASSPRKYLAFILSPTQLIYRKVTAAVDNGNGTETLTIDSAPGTTLPAASTMVSFLCLSRLDSDEVEIAWETQNVAQATLALVEIPNEVPA